MSFTSSFSGGQTTDYTTIIKYSKESVKRISREILGGIHVALLKSGPEVFLSSFKILIQALQKSPLVVLHNSLRFLQRLHLPGKWPWGPPTSIVDTPAGLPLVPDKSFSIVQEFYIFDTSRYRPIWKL